MFVEKENSGIVFFNDSENENAPQLSGQINIDGQQYRIAMWLNEGKKGDFYGVMLQPVDADVDEAPKRSGGRGGEARRASRSSRGGGRSAGRGKPRR